MRLCIKYKDGRRETKYPEAVQIEGGRLYYQAIGGRICIPIDSDNVLSVSLEDEPQQLRPDDTPAPYMPFLF